MLETRLLGLGLDWGQNCGRTDSLMVLRSLAGAGTGMHSTSSCCKWKMVPGAGQLMVAAMSTSLLNRVWKGRLSLYLLASQVSPRSWGSIILWNWTPSKDNLFIHWIKWVTNTAVWFCILKGYWSNNLWDKTDTLKLSTSTLFLNAFWSTNGFP